MELDIKNQMQLDIDKYLGDAPNGENASEEELLALEEINPFTPAESEITLSLNDEEIKILNALANKERKRFFRRKRNKVATSTLFYKICFALRPQIMRIYDRRESEGLSTEIV